MMELFQIVIRAQQYPCPEAKAAMSLLVIPVIEIIERIIWKLPVGAKNKDLSRVIFDDRKRADTKICQKVFRAMG